MRVNTQDFPEIMPGSAGDNYQRQQASPQAFGAGTGRAIAGMGEEIGTIANAFQDMHNQTISLDAATEYSRKVSDLEIEHAKLQGLNAVNALPDYQKKIVDLQSTIAEGLPNEAVRFAFTNQTRNYRESTLRSMDLHAADQSEKAHVSALDGSIDAARTQAVLHYGRSDVEPDFSQTVSAAAAKAQFLGLDKTGADALVQSEVGKTMQDIIVSRIASGRSVEAKQIFDEALGQKAPGTDLPMLAGDKIPGIEEAVNIGVQKDAKDFLKSLDPTVAVQLLMKAEKGKTGTLVDYISDGDRAEMLRTARKSMQADVNERLSSDLAIKVGEGTATIGEVNDAFNKNIISGAQRASWIVEIGKTKDYIPTVMGALAGTSILDPKDTSDRNAVSTYFDKVVAPQLAQAKPDEAKSVITTYVEKTGIVPDTLRGQIRGSLRAGNPQQRIGAADMIDRLSETAPQALSDFSNEDIATGQYIAGLVRAGVDPEKAVEMSDALANLPEGVKDQRKKDLAATSGKLLTAGMNSVISKVEGQSWLGRIFSTPNVGDAAKAEFRNDFEQAYILTGDPDVAAKTAVSMAQRTWGISHINDRPELMKYAPETIYGVRDHGPDDAKWIREQLLDEVTAKAAFDPSKGKIEDRVTLAPDLQTARDLTYLVMLKNENGAYEPLADAAGKPLRWKPDFKTSAEAKRLEQKQLDTVSRARTEREVFDTNLESGTLGGPGF